MASGYVTSDGKDLDERYLGITDKAKSAEIADSAVQITSALNLIRTSTPIAVSISNSPYAVNMYALASYLGTRYTLNGTTNLRFAGDALPVQPGDIITYSPTGSNPTNTFYLTPIKIITEE